MPNFEITPASAKVSGALYLRVADIVACVCIPDDERQWRSPHLSSLTPMTAASDTPWHCERRSSSCSDEPIPPVFYDILDPIDILM